MQTDQRLDSLAAMVAAAQVAEEKIRARVHNEDNHIRQAQKRRGINKQRLLITKENPQIFSITRLSR